MFTFVDLFAGIGGFHLGCVGVNGGRCVLACEIDADARKIYEINHGVVPHDDIYTLHRIPANVDLVCAGFPCQSHSTLGLRKGMNDARGKLFYRLCDVIKACKPKAFLFENVKGIMASPSFSSMMKQLEDLGYKVTWFVLDSQNFNIPQHRERVYIVGHRTLKFDPSTLVQTHNITTLNAVLDRTIDMDELACNIFDGVTIDNLNQAKQTKSRFILRAQLSNYTNRKLFSSNGIIGTINTGSPPPIYDEKRRIVRHLSRNELKKCQGFPASFQFPADFSRTSVVHYIGNSVTVSVIQAIVLEMRLQRLL